MNASDSFLHRGEKRRKRIHYREYDYSEPCEMQRVRVGENRIEREKGREIKIANLSGCGRSRGKFPIIIKGRQT